MSIVTKEEILGLSKLARLRLSDLEIDRLQSDLTGILEHMKVLSEVDTEGVLPMTHVDAKAHSLRPDVVAPSLNRERILAAAHRSDDDCFAVPSILPGAES